MSHVSRPSNFRPLLLAGIFSTSIGIALPTSALAGVNTWTQLGPEGGALCALAVAPSDPSTVYAVGASLFRSADNGRTWESTGAPVEGSSCILAVDSADPLRLYSVRQEGVWRSLDGGTTWTASSNGLPSFDSRAAIVVDPHDSSFLVLVSGYGATYRSRDRGDSWQQILGRPGVVSKSVAIDPSTAGRALALSYSEGVFISNDYGDSWVPASGGLPENLSPKGLVVDPLDSAVIYVHAYSGIYRSRNDGASWSLILPVAGEYDQVEQIVLRSDSSVFVLKRSPSLMLLLRSGDGGDTWQELPFPNDPYLGISDLAATPAALLATSLLGFVRSIDDGASWHESNSGLLAASVGRLELDRQNPERIYGLPRSSFEGLGILRSQDRGATWQHLPVATSAGEAFVVDFLVDPNDPRHFLVAALYSSPGGRSGLASSLDAGETWSALADPISCQHVTELVIDPLQLRRLFLLAMRGPFCYPGCYNFTSGDSGETWQCIPPEELPEILQHMVPSPYTKGIVLALGFAGIYRSTNSGENWTRVAGAPTYDPGYAGDIEWASADTAYATSAGAGLFVSHDGGQSWEPRSTPPEVPQIPWMVELAVEPFHPERIYAISKGSQYAPPSEVVASSDGGRTWEARFEGLAGWALSDLQIDPVTPNRLYASAYGGGILAYDVQKPEPCVPSATALCITDGRFKVESIWRDFAGRSGIGHAVPLAADTGAFWFFDPDNLELFAKEIDGVGFNNAFWTFYGALSNVEFTLLATDMATGAQHGYFNPIRTFASRGDIESFPQEEGLSLPVSAASSSNSLVRPRAAPQRSANACVPNATTLCLAGGRFAASVTWHDFAGRSGVGTPIVLTPDTGSFWFFDAGIHELAVKVIDGRGTNNAYWVFYGSLSNVEFELTVVDTATGESWTRENPSGTFASNGDIEAFPQ